MFCGTHFYEAFEVIIVGLGLLEFSLTNLCDGLTSIMCCSPGGVFCSCCDGCILRKG